MIKFEHTEVLGWEHAIRGMRNPFNSWQKSDSYFDGKYCDVCPHKDSYCDPNEPCFNVVLGENDRDLMKRLRNAGTDHRKFMRMITVYVDIIAPLYFFKEFETYKVGTVSNSCSTMHKIHAKEFTLEDFSCEHLFDDYSLEGQLTYGCFDTGDDDFCYTSKDALQVICDILNHHRFMYLETKDKKYWWQMIQLLPSSYNQRRTVMLNYEVLANIYKSRKDHRLDEWHDFCDWIKTLPYSELITGAKIEEKEDSPWIPCTDENAKMPEEGDEVLCTLKEDWSFGNQRDVQYHVFEGEYKLTKEDCYDMPAANGKGYFEANNDWDEGQPLSVIAWMPKPIPYKE